MIEKKERPDTNRLDAFSDGVFAIAITLLALNLQAPKLRSDATGVELAAALARQWPTYMAFLSSFLTILVMWINHHRIFLLVKIYDGWLGLANGLLLLVITAVPFPTMILADHFTGEAAGMATAFYAGFYVLVNIAFNLLWFTISYRRRLLWDDVPDAVVRTVRGRLLIGFPVYVAASLVSLVSPHLGLVVCLILWIHWAKLVTIVKFTSLVNIDRGRPAEDDVVFSRRPG